MDRIDRTYGMNNSDAPEGVSDPLRRCAQASAPRGRWTKAPRGHEVSEGSGPSRESESSYQIGYRRPPFHSRFQKGHRGFKRRKDEPREPRDFFEEVIHELEQTVTVNENGKRRKLRGRTVGAKSMARAIAKGEGKAVGLLLQYLKSRPAYGEPDTPPKNRRRRLHEIMFDFHRDIHEEIYQNMCDITGKTDHSGDEVLEQMATAVFNEHPTFVDKHFELLILFFMCLPEPQLRRKLRDCLALCETCFENGGAR